ncbi:O-methyltransferase [Tirmania nivea]|nr:O-methyltransferase [Tirmania nivea]
MHTATELYSNPTVANAVHKYCIEHSLPVGEQVENHREATINWAEKTGRNMDMMVNTLQSQFMMWFIKAMGVKKVLEIGCFMGYSTLSFAHALRGTPSASITTLDLPGPHTTLARTLLASAQSSSSLPPLPQIYLLEGPATASLAHLSTQKAYYDLIFLDANKDQYTTYLNLILSLKLLSPRGVILCDNVLKMGLVADSTENNPAARKEVRGEEEGYDDGYGGSMGGKERVDHLRQAEWLDGFNKAVKGDERVECVVLPVFDGLSFIRLRDGGLDGREKLV